MWTDGEVFRSYGAQKADLKGVDIFFSSSLIACTLSHKGCPGPLILSVVATSEVQTDGRQVPKMLALGLQISPVNGLFNLPGR